jgi:hypothetical protein
VYWSSFCALYRVVDSLKQPTTRHNSDLGENVRNPKGPESFVYCNLFTWFSALRGPSLTIKLAEGRA